jgi:MYXO-CTERM domain-containing protein
MRKRALATIAVPLVALVGTATAVRSPDYLDERPLETADGGRGRAFRDVTWDRAPDSAKKAWTRFLVTHAGTWRTQWDRTTEVPLRIWGEGIAVPGSMASPAIAERAARDLLALHVGLLAPGAKADDFELVSNVVHGDGEAMRTVGFFQRWNGMRVVGGQVSFLFKKDRVIVIGSQALPHVKPSTSPRQVSADAARIAAVAWVDAAYATHTVGGTVSEPLLLPVIRDKDDGTQAVEYRVALTVDVDSQDPRARWDVYVDAATGAPIARTQKLRFATGNVRYKVPPRYPGQTRMDYPAALANVRVGQSTIATDAAGVLTWTGTAAATVTPAATGLCAAVGTASGSPATGSLTLQPSGTTVWDHSTSETNDAQVIAFIHATIVNRYAKSTMNPNLAWLDRPISVRVNESGNCNAYSTGDDIHFYRSSTQCENTGRLADVVYHEFGHSLHGQSIIQGAGEFDGALSEGVSDYLAATLTNDHGMGRGFFKNNDALRDIDPVGGEKRWPDDRTGQVHNDGEIIGGTLWDLRKGMIAALGAGPGVAKTDDLYYAILQRASDIPSSYVEAIAADDDDGNLANGTPNQCVIQNAFAAHGLASGDGGVSIGVGHPERDGFTIDVPVEAPAGDCPVADVQSATVAWQVRGAGSPAEVQLTEGASSWSGAIPAQASGTVVQYKVTVTLTDGTAITYPDNAADPMYEFWVGPVEEIWCTDFETDPAGWTHGATAGADDFAFGMPTGAGDDPTAAFSGARVFGNDLGGGTNDGAYEPSVDLWARTPEIEVGQYESVRLQYRRWLGVEDAFFDDASISVDGTQLWANKDSMNGNNSSTHHKDKEWRFQDVDITAQAADGKVQVTFNIKSDEGLEMGGWTMDDVCIVGWSASLASCGDGVVGAGEQCDDGNTTDGDGCSASCVDEDGPGPDDPPGGDQPGGCCSTSKDDPTGFFLLLSLCALVLARRRRIL